MSYNVVCIIAYMVAEYWDGFQKGGKHDVMPYGSSLDGVPATNDWISYVRNNNIKI